MCLGWSQDLHTRSKLPEIVSIQCDDAGNPVGYGRGDQMCIVNPLSAARRFGEQRQEGREDWSFLGEKPNDPAKLAYIFQRVCKSHLESIGCHRPCRHNQELANDLRRKNQPRAQLDEGASRCVTAARFVSNLEQHARIRQDELSACRLRR